MHELSVCQALIGQVEAIAEKENAARVVAIHLDIGPLSGVEPQLLKQAFYIARAGSIASDAQLHIDSLPVRVSCQKCGQFTDALPARLICGNCGDWHTKVVSGDELLLSQVELIRNRGGRQDDPENLLQFGG